MIPESEGATPYGIFLLADDFLSAAVATHAASRIGPAPVRLLCFHAAELFMKTYMRSAGETIERLRGMGHDLELMASHAEGLGLQLPQQVLDQSRKFKRKNDYVRTRYTVVDMPDDTGAASAIRYCKAVREAVRCALNMDADGVPQGQHWLNGFPPDYPVKGRVADK